eukprot:scaffold1815_cov147-Skeletonema_dohrnii-CCMP3373.AAC.11
MDHQVVDNEDRFVYMGGKAPQHVINAIIHESVKEIDEHAFAIYQGDDDEGEDGDNHTLRSVVFHAGVETVRTRAFGKCPNLVSLKLPGVRTIEFGAFRVCSGLTDVEFGDKLDTIQDYAFYCCSSLRGVTIPSATSIGDGTFYQCTSLTDAVFGEGLESIGSCAFHGCRSLRRIAIPLKDDMFRSDFGYHQRNYHQFDECINLSTVDLVGGIHETVASLHLEKWRNEMIEEINLINRVLPYTDEYNKSEEIVRWIPSVIRKIESFKAAHRELLKEATTLLELALWKANVEWIDDKEEEQVRITRGRAKRARREKQITSGAMKISKCELAAQKTNVYEAFLGTILDIDCIMLKVKGSTP